MDFKMQNLFFSCLFLRIQKETPFRRSLSKHKTQSNPSKDVGLIRSP